jgi:hypothetical protein
MLRALLKGCGGREGLVAAVAVCSLFLQSVSFGNLVYQCIISVVPRAPFSTSYNFQRRMSRLEQR